MATTYDYTYDYEVKDTNKQSRAPIGNAGGQNQRPVGHAPSNASTHSTFGRANNINDALVNLQHDRIWNKLYDPLNTSKSPQEAEVQKMARRQDRKVIKIEAAYGSDRQTVIIKRNYDLRVRDLQEDISKLFKMPVDQIILYWKGKNICDSPNELLEALGIENNHQMRVCREDDPAQQNRRRELRSMGPSDQQYPSSNDMYAQQQQFYPSYQPQQPYQPMYDQQQYAAGPRGNYYQQLTNPNYPPSNATANTLNLQVAVGDRRESVFISRPHPITVYDLQAEFQQRFNIPILEQNASYNGMPLSQVPPDATADSLGIINNSFISLWYKNSPSYAQQQGSPAFYGDGQTARAGPNDLSSMRGDNSMNANDPMQNGSNPDVLKIEVYHGSDRHVLILRSANNLRVVDLMEELQRITTVPIQSQKLFFRGQELQQMKDRSLRDVGMDNNGQIRLIGEPTKARYEPMITGNRAN